MIPAIISASTGRNVADDMVLYDVVSSLIKNTEARDACLIMVMNSLPSAGSIFLIACGRIICVIVWLPVIPRLRAASVWPLSTACIPALITSAT